MAAPHLAFVDFALPGLVLPEFVDVALTVFFGVFAGGVFFSPGARPAFSATACSMICRA
jgi:hypothetical protein